MHERSLRRVILILFAVIIILGGALAVIFSLDSINGGIQHFFSLDSWDDITIHGKKYKQKDTTTNYLIVGIDKDTKSTDVSYNNTEQADFLAVLSVDRKDHSYTVLQINRDTMTNVRQLGLNGQFAGRHFEQIALAHTYGDGGEISSSNTASTVSEFLNKVHIDKYITISMNAVKDLTDYVEGVDIVCDRDYTEINPEMTEGATVTLDGEKAMAFVRSRSTLSDSTNLSRMHRQKVFIEGVLAKFHNIDDMSDSYMLGAYESIKDNMVTSCSQSEFYSLYQQMNTFENKGMYQLEGETKKGEFIEFYPDKKKLEELIIMLYTNGEA